MNHRRVMSRWLRMAAARNLQVFDFDDTLVSSQGSVSVKKASGEDLNMDSATFAHYKPSDGDELDFGAFNDVINPRIIKKNFDHLKESLKQPDTKVVILTARSKGAETSVKKFLDSLGIKDVQVVGLASSDPEDKAKWIDQAIKDEHAEQVDFFDDSSANAAAVAAHGERHKAEGVKFESHNTPHPHEADYDGPVISTHFKSSNPQNAKVQYRSKTPVRTEKPEPGHKPSDSDWWHDQTDTFQHKYCDDHPASGHCASSMLRTASNESLVKKIQERAKKSGNKKVIQYIDNDFTEKMEQAGQQAGAWFDGLDSAFDTFRRKPEGLFKGFKPQDFDDLYEALFGVDAMKSKKNASVSKVADQFILGNLLACLKAAHHAHWTAHWTTEGQSFYGDHLLFDKLYSAIPEEIDGLAEKIVALYGAAGVALPEQMLEMARYITKWVTDHPNLVNRALAVEADIQMAIETARNAMKAEGALSLGLDNFLQGVADSHETPLYLLGQRAKDSVSRVASRHLAKDDFLDVSMKNTLEKWKDMFGGKVNFGREGHSFSRELIIPCESGLCKVLPNSGPVPFTIEFLQFTFADGEGRTWVVRMSGGTIWPKEKDLAQFSMGVDDYGREDLDRIVGPDFHRMVSRAESVLRTYKHQFGEHFRPQHWDDWSSLNGD